MADLLERIRNVYDDHQDRERRQARQEGYVAAVHETRDALLSSALATQHQWREEVQAAGPNSNHEAIHAKYAARLQGLNDAFAALRQGDPGITTQIDVEQFKQSATERIRYQRQEHSLADNRIDHGYDYSISY
ncbi:MAG: hypothetical protein ACR2JB_05940 [Bryobacteraceae bacterium]